MLLWFDDRTLEWTVRGLLLVCMTLGMRRETSTAGWCLHYRCWNVGTWRLGTGAWAGSLQGLSVDFVTGAGAVPM